MTYASRLLVPILVLVFMVVGAQAVYAGASCYYTQTSGGYFDAGTTCPAPYQDPSPTPSCSSAGDAGNSYYVQDGGSLGQGDVGSSCYVSYQSFSCECVAVPDPPCTSAPNSCGMTSTGTVVNGVCNATTPPNSQCPQPTCADLGQQGTYPQCWTPTTCTSAPNACGATNSGMTTSYSGTCSASTPPTVDACPSDAGLQCDVSQCSAPQTCTPDTSCAANTCTTSTCTATASNCSTYQIAGTMNCAASCTPSAACAANTCTGNSCTDSCGNVYSGTKTGGSCTPSCTDSATPTLSATPNRVQVGVPTAIKFTWSDTDASAACQLSGANIATVSTAAPSSCNISGNYTTAPLSFTQQIVYTLTCPGNKKATAIVNIIPKYKEF